MSLTVVTPPTEDLLTLTEVRDHLGLGGITDFDAELPAHLAAATALLEAATQRRFLTQTLEWPLDGWPATWIRLPVAPVAIDGVVDVVYADASGVLTTMPTADYVVSRWGPTLSLRPLLGASWPLLDPDAAEPVTITFEAGELAADIDPLVKLAARFVIANSFRNRGDEAAMTLAASKLSPAVEALIGPLRWD